MMKQCKSRFAGPWVAFALTAGLLVAPASAQKLYKWVDEQGNITYQDQPPPEDAKVLEEYQAAGDDSGDVSGAAVTLYSVPQCDACDLVRLILQKNSVPFEEKNPGKDSAAADELKQKSGQLSVPSLTVGDKLIVGYNTLAIRDELKNAGYTLQDETGGDREAAAGPAPAVPGSAIGDQPEAEAETEAEPGTAAAESGSAEK